MLFVTNGDCVGDRLAAGWPSATVLPWRDLLHEGPIPAGLDPTALAETRAGFLADCGWAEASAARDDLAGRDRVLADHRGPIVVWFERDLYDQLQLIQILDRLTDLPPDAIDLVDLDDAAIGSPATAAGLAALFDTRRPIGPPAIDLARRAFAAVRDDSPIALGELVDVESADLPYLGGALRRLAQEYPEPGTGLSRTERQIHEAVGRGVHHPDPLFDAATAPEEHRFLSDSAFDLIVGRLSDGSSPLLGRADGVPFQPRRSAPDSYNDQAIVTTAAGRAVLAGRSDWIEAAGIDRWVGGVRLRRPGGRVWRWDDSGSTFRADAGQAVGSAAEELRGGNTH